MKNILIIGSSGQLGEALKENSKKFIKKDKINLLLPSKDEFNLKNKNACEEFIKKYSPDWTINTAAYTKVDHAESEFDEAMKINGESLLYISNYLKKYGGKLIHISTDAIFQSLDKRYFKIDEKPNPINIYGASKLEGENFVKKILFP